MGTQQLVVVQATKEQAQLGVVAAKNGEVDESSRDGPVGAVAV